VTLALAAEMLNQAGLAGSNADGVRLAREALDSGRAAETFGRMVHALGGPSGFIDDCRAFLPKAEIGKTVSAPRSGYVTGIATREIGLAVVGLGGGRRKPGDTVDHAVGITDLLPVGAAVAKGDALAIIRARSETNAEEAAAAVLAAYSLGEARPTRRKPVLRRVAE
jgi:thymidine phosphorylase